MCVFLPGSWRLYHGGSRGRERVEFCVGCVQGVSVSNARACSRAGSCAWSQHMHALVGCNSGKPAACVWSVQHMHALVGCSDCLRPSAHACASVPQVEINGMFDYEMLEELEKRGIRPKE